MRRKKEKDDLGLITEAREPFSLSNFFRVQAAGKFRHMKRILKEKGVLFFLFSPFQARSRLVVQLFLLAAGILFGIIPRATSMVSAVQDMAYQSEVHGLTQKRVGDLTITPAASSHYERRHLLAFVLSGKNLPSSVSRYDVRLARSYGASDWGDVTYSYNLFPVDNDRRILLVCLDQTEQASGYGAFRLLVSLSGEEDLEDYAVESSSFEIVISTAQETSGLYDRDGIHLSALTEAICGNGGIEEAESALQDALDAYQIALEQAEAMPIGITVTPTTEDLETYCLRNHMYRTLEDDSTVADLAGIREAVSPELSYNVVLTSGGIPYDEVWMEEHEDAQMTSDESRIAEEFDHVNEAKDAVISAMEAVNAEAAEWYNTLKTYEIVLTQTPELSDFPVTAPCMDSLFAAPVDEETSDVPEDGTESTSGGMPEGTEEDVSEETSEPIEGETSLDNTENGGGQAAGTP